MKNLFLLFVLFASGSALAGFPSTETLILLGDKVSEYRLNKRHKLLYKDVKLVEYILYKGDHFRSQLKTEKEFKKKFGTGLTLQANLGNRTLRYQLSKKLTIDVLEGDDSVSYVVKKKGAVIDQASIPLIGMSDDYVKALKQELYQLTLSSRGMSTFQMEENVALNADHTNLIDDEKESLTLRIKESFYDDHTDTTKWEYLPVKLITYPVQKVFYDLPNMATSTAVEAVTRSPLHNIQGAGDEFKGAGLGIWNGLKDLVKGVFHPRQATFFDGVLGIGDASLKIVKGGLGIAKSAVSIVGYPIYRVFGGAKSKRVPLRGKRATIVIIDTGMPSQLVNGIVDTYGETIIRGQLKSIGQYYCVHSSALDNVLYDCIDNIPSNVQYVDFFALTHTGGTDKMERYAKYAAEKRGVKPELMISIGCYDDPSNLTEKENTVGQKKTSWAVHYYLSNLISKRLRGIPMQEAANEAFIEGIPTNIVNPVSLGGYAAVSLMESDIGLGYYGSKPDLNTDEKIARNLIANAWGKLDSSFRDYQWDYLIEENSKRHVARKDLTVDPSKIVEAIDAIKKVHAFLDQRIDSLPKKSTELIARSKELLTQVESVASVKQDTETRYTFVRKISTEQSLSKTLGIDLTTASFLAAY